MRIIIFNNNILMAMDIMKKTPQLKCMPYSAFLVVGLLIFVCCYLQAVAAITTDGSGHCCEEHQSGQVNERDRSESLKIVLAGLNLKVKENKDSLYEKFSLWEDFANYFDKEGKVGEYYYLLGWEKASGDLILPLQCKSDLRALVRSLFGFKLYYNLIKAFEEKLIQLNELDFSDDKFQGMLLEFFLDIDKFFWERHLESSKDSSFYLKAAPETVERVPPMVFPSVLNNEVFAPALLLSIEVRKIIQETAFSALRELYFLLDDVGRAKFEQGQKDSFSKRK